MSTPLGSVRLTYGLGADALFRAPEGRVQVEGAVGHAAAPLLIGAPRLAHCGRRRCRGPHVLPMHGGLSGTAALKSDPDSTRPDAPDRCDMASGDSVGGDTGKRSGVPPDVTAGAGAGVVADTAAADLARTDARRAAVRSATCAALGRSATRAGARVGAVALVAVRAPGDLGDRVREGELLTGDREAEDEPLLSTVSGTVPVATADFSGRLLAGISFACTQR